MPRPARLFPTCPPSPPASHTGVLIRAECTWQACTRQPRSQTALSPSHIRGLWFIVRKLPRGTAVVRTQAFVTCTSTLHPETGPKWKVEEKLLENALHELCMQRRVANEPGNNPHTTLEEGKSFFGDTKSCLGQREVAAFQQVKLQGSYQSLQEEVQGPHVLKALCHNPDRI